MKKIIFTICLALSCLIICFCLSKQTVNFKGVFTENNKEYNVELLVTNRRIDKILNRMSGTVVVQPENRTAIEYKSMGTVFDMKDGCFWVTISRYNENKNSMSFGNLYFDKEFDNIALIDDEYQIYIANEKFTNTVKFHESKKQNP